MVICGIEICDGYARLALAKLRPEGCVYVDAGVEKVQIFDGVNGILDSAISELSAVLKNKFVSAIIVVDGNRSFRRDDNITFETIANFFQSFDVDVYSVSREVLKSFSRSEYYSMPSLVSKMTRLPYTASVWYLSQYYGHKITFDEQPRFYLSALRRLRRWGRRADSLQPLRIQDQPRSTTSQR